MADLGNPSRTKEIMQKYDFVLKKKFGQNFLIDDNILKKIVSSSGVTKDDFVVEIGPGIGAMTQHLCEAAGKVIAVEIDDKLIPVLGETLGEYDNVRVINNDILKMDLNELAAKENDGKPFHIVANLPYYITTPIIMGLFESHAPIASITVMIQKEVADRMKAGPKSKDYGALSLAVQYYSNVEIVAEVSPKCFIPAPKVGSTVVHLERAKAPKVEVADEKLMFSLIRAAFNQRRKTLANALKNSPLLQFSKEEIESSILRIDKKVTVRGEELSLEEFAKLTGILKEIHG
ncbi:16S rRNA (adenine(1518)-N(6)/adenine(1519)-N(6))-dimethyltransferase RsmA [Lachnospiraceae bacterium C1.1]|nr:16S rRNA (adenine(1518)-N(6)/adenine(1519)-N(6))-dimethyltransferase RsmA [Lachnospiraceae bacterium C1.1]